MNVTIREAALSDIIALKDRLRREDAEEVISAGSESVESALAQSIARSTSSYTVGLDGVPVGIFGLCPDSIAGDSANIWFLGTPEMGRIKKTFVKESRRVIDIWLHRYRFLWNTVPLTYYKTLRWLKALGATFVAVDHEAGVVLFKIERAN